MLERAAIVSMCLATAMGGCGSSANSSCEFSTDELSMVATVTDDGFTVRAEVSFTGGERADLGIPVNLCGDDRLTINADEPRGLEKPDRTVYSVTQQVDGAPSSFELELRREGGGSFSTTIDLPEAFTIKTPLPDTTIPRNEEVALTWTPAVEGGEIAISVEEEIGGGLCIVTSEEDHEYKALGGVRVEDDGDWTIPAGVFSSESGEACEARYVLSRTALGAYPEELLAGGFVEGRVIRWVYFQSEP